MTASKQCLLFAWLLLPQLLSAADPLPRPLTLEAALATADNASHFELIRIDERYNALASELGIEQGERGFSVDLKARLRQVGPSSRAAEDPTGDNAASLIFSKPIYDFGLANSEEKLLLLQLQALEVEKQALIEKRRLSIMQKYFATLDADNEFISENEALAMGYIHFDRARENRELGLEADIEVMRLQAEYETTRQKRYLAEHQQRLTRSILAEEMGHPDAIPSELLAPQLEPRETPQLELAPLVQQAREYSAEAKLMRLRTSAAQSLIRISETSNNPRLDFEIELSSYERETSTSDDWRVGLYFDMPLYSQSNSSRVSRASARYHQALAEQQHFESKLRLQLLQLLQEIQQTRLLIEGTEIAQNYRELYLDRSRAEYELEYKSDLGDSMVEYSRSNAARLKALYAHELAFQRLVALVGPDFLER